MNSTEDSEIYFQKKPLYCLNCGRKGHVGKKCKEPPTSYGIMCFNLTKEFYTFQKILEQKYIHYPKVNVNKINLFWFNNKNKNTRDEVNNIIEDIKRHIKILLIRRKNSLGFIEFMRGRYDVEDPASVTHLIEQMTAEEKDMLLTKSFDEIWVMLWKNNSRNKLYEREYNLSLDKFEQLDKSIIEETRPKYDIPEWGFPKGRRNYFEKDIECAQREFTEETGLEDSEITILDRIYPITETFTGTNQVKYKHVYFLGTIPFLKDVHVGNSEMQKQEVGDIGWFSFDKVMELIRPYHTERKKLIEDFVYFLAFNIRYYKEHFF